MIIIIIQISKLLAIFLDRNRSCNRRTPPDGFAEQNGRDAERAD